MGKLKEKSTSFHLELYQELFTISENHVFNNHNHLWYMSQQLSLAYCSSHCIFYL